MFQVVHEGENYAVHTDRLPEVYIEKRVPLYHFEFGGDSVIVCQAMDRGNVRRTPVVVFRAESTDPVTFRICIRPESVEAFTDILDECFLRPWMRSDRHARWRFGGKRFNEHKHYYTEKRYEDLYQVFQEE